MINIENIKPTYIILTENTNDKDALYNNLKNTATTVVFSHFLKKSYHEFLIFSGFEPIKDIKDHYVKKVGSLILVVEVYLSYIKSKHWIQYTEKNLEYIKSAEAINSFLFYDNDEITGDSLYHLSIDVPFYENFVISIGRYGPPLTRVDLGFKYENKKFMSISLHKDRDECIQICYDDYLVDNHPYPSFIEFKLKKITAYKISNKNNNICLLKHKDHFDLNHITLDNVHLSHEQFTTEQKQLIELLLI